MGQLEHITVEHIGRNVIGGTYNPLFTRKFDPFGPNVVSLLHFDDIVGTTIPADTLPGVVWTNAAPTYNVVSNAQAVFAGGNSFFHDGANAPSGYGLKASFPALPGKVFTADIRFRFSLFSTNSLYGQGDRTNRFCTIETSDTNNRTTINVDGVTGLLLIEGIGGSAIATSATIAANTWYALAVIYDGTNYLMFLDGVLVLSQVAISAVTGAVDWTPVNCPWGNGALGKLFVDEARLTWGVARYSAAAPPIIETAPFIYP